MAITCINFLYEKRVDKLVYRTILEAPTRSKAETINKFLDLGELVRELPDDSIEAPEAEILVWEDAKNRFKLARLARLNRRGM